MFGFGNGTTSTVPGPEGTCPSNNPAWCYNPMVMYLMKTYPGLLSTAGSTDIRATFKQALKDVGYVPTSSSETLKPPAQAVAAAVAYHQPYLAATVSYATLMSDASAAYLETGGQILQLPGVTPAPSAATIKIPLLPLPAPKPAPAPQVSAATIAKIFHLTPTGPVSAKAATVTPTPASTTTGTSPWVWAGLGLVAVGGLFLLMK